MSCPTLTHDDQHHSDTALANLFNDKFIAVRSSLPSFDWSPSPVDEFPSDFYISLDEVGKVLRSSKIRSPSGPDEISSWHLRENASAFWSPLCSIFNACVLEGCIPSLRKSANVTPIQKCSALDVDSDFRSIFLIHPL